MTRNLYAILVGIDDYPAPVSKLDGCVNDINAIEDYLKTRVDSSQHGNIKTLRNAEATRQAVIDGCEKHLTQAGKDDVVLFYFCGHGSQEPASPEFSYLERDGKLETLVCWDSRTSTRDLANKELRYLIAKVAERNPHIVIVLDCCHSGSGTRDVEYKQKVRHTPADQRPRKIEEFIFANDVAVVTLRSQKHGDTWDLPEGRHVLLAACEDRELASEYSGDVKTRGAFSYFLLDALNKTNSNLSYRDFFKEVSSRVRSRIKNQTPRLEANNPEDLDNLSFLGGSDIIKPREPFFTLKHNGKDWEIDGGAIHGFPKISNISIKLALYSQGSTPEQMRQLSEAVGEAEVIEVLPDRSIVEFTQEPTNLTEDTILRAIAISLPPPTIGVYLEGDSEALEQVRQQLQRVSPGEKPSLYIREEPELAKAQYRLLAKDEQYVITKPSDDRPLVEPLKGYEKAFRAVKNLEHIARWTTTIDLANPESQILANAVKVQIYHNGEEVKEPHLRLEYEYRNGKWHQPTFRVKLTNTYEQRLFCAILDVAEDYSVSVPPLFPQGELSYKGGLWIEPGEEVDAAIWNGNRKIRDDIPASVADKIWKQGVTEYQDVFKLIISTAEFDANLLCQDDLLSPSVESSDRSRELPSRLNTLNWLMYQIQSRQFGVVEEIDDWVTSQISITTVRPKDAVPLNPQASTDLSFGVTIEPHSGLRAEARLSSVPPSTRDAGSPTLPPILGDYTQPFQFTASRGVDSGLSVLELQVNDRETIKSVTPENPLVVSVNKSITQNEYILPVAYDGEFWLPLGQGKGKDSKTEIRIERIPTLDSEQTSGEKRRSLGSAIRIYFQKVIYENLGQESPYPKLRIARVAEDGTVSYEKDEQQIKAAVAKAQHIALYIHGIIGDTESIVPSVRQAKVMVNGQSKSLTEIYDLVLTFDYENLNTPIKELGRQLRDKLAAVGLKPNHGKTLHIVAHSMGGLVSRSFIEQWQGNRVVQHLFMLGTPNAGSPWAAVQDLVTFALAAGLNGLSSVVFPAKVLADLVALIEEIDVNLDEMHPTKSQFLQELKDCADPQCSYSIIAGNTSLIPQQEEAINRLQAALQRTWRRAIEFPFIKEANDIAVTVKSIVSVPEERSPVAYIQDRVACDHLSYFRHPAGLDALARAVARAFPDYSGPTTPLTTPHPPHPNPIAPGGNTGKGTPSSPSPQPPGNSPGASTSQPSARSTSEIMTSPTAQSESGFANSYAAVIGINKYQSGIPPLGTAVNDAQEIAEILESEQKYTLISPSKSASQIENKAWLDENATLENLNALFKTLKDTVGSNDRLLFYFAGHGTAINSEDGPQGYLIPQDAKYKDLTTYLSMSQLRKLLAQLPCRHCLIILDCCYSGAFRWSNTRQFGHVREIFKDNFDLFINDPAWQVITSSAHDQTAADEMVLENNRDFGNADHSPFAIALMKALRDEAADTYPPAKDDKPAGDGIITADELYQYVRYQIELETAQRNKRQTPGLWIVDEKHDKGVYVFLTKHFDKTKLPPAPTLDDTKESNPYRGLESYEEKHSLLFFGRTKLIEELCDRVCESPLTVVLGASGSGKSSLVKAGLVPHLKRSPEEAQQSQVLISLQDDQTHLHKHQKWEILKPIHPGKSPAKTLENALEGTNLDTIPTETKLLLVIDQFEELVTQCRDRTEREQFLRRISEQLEKYSGRLHFVLTLRSDFEPQLRESVEAELKKHKNLASLLNAQQPNQSEDVESKQQPEERIWNAARFIVPLMTREELQEAIEAPAAVKAIQFDSDKRNNRTLVQQLIHEVADMPGALPLVSFALNELYRKLAKRFIDALTEGRTGDRTITWADYDELGGVTQSVTKTANDVYDNLLKNNPKEKDAYARTIRNVMLRMISLQGSELARRQVRWSELEYPNKKENERVETIIGCFQDARLIVEGTDSEDKPYVEPAHDALVRGWDKLKQWKQEEQVALSLQRRLTPQAEEWKNKKQSSSLLGKSEPFLDWCDKRIDSVEDWLNPSKEDDQQSQPENKIQFLWNGDPYLDVLKRRLKSYDHWFNQVETEFVQKSVWQRRRYTYLRWQIAIGVMLLSSGLTLWALWALIGSWNAQIAQIRALINSSDARFAASQEFDALLDSLRATRKLEALFPTSRDSQMKAQNAQFLQQAVYGVRESYRLKGNGRPLAWGSDGQISWNLDGQTLAFVSGDQTVKLWRQDGTEPQILKGYSSQVVGVSWSPDGQTLATVSSEDTTVKLWRSDGTPLNTFKVDGYQAYGINWSPDGELLAIPCINGIQLRKRDGTLPSLKSNSISQKSAFSVSWNPKQPTFASSGQDGKVHLWNRDGTLIKSSKNYGQWVLAASWHPDGQILAIAVEGRVRLLRSDLTELETVESKGDQVMSWTPNGQTLATAGSADRTVKLWQWDGKKLLQIATFRSPTPIASLKWSLDGQTLATLDRGDGTVRLWKKNNPLQLTLNHHSQGVNDASLSRDGQILATASDDGTVKLWTREGAFLKTLDGFCGGVKSVSWSPDGQILAASDCNSVKLWTRKGTPLQTLTGHGNYVYSVSWSPDGQVLLASGGGDHKVKLWKRDGAVIPVGPFRNWVVGVNWSPDGQILAVAVRNGSVFLQKPDGSRIKTLDEAGNAISWGPDGQTLATSGGNTIKLWNRDGTLRKNIPSGSDGVGRIAWHPNGQILATTSQDTIKVWKLDGTVLTILTGHTDVVNSVTWSLDGQTLVSASNDHTVKLWQLNDHLDNQLLNDLLGKGCNWMRDYLKNSPNVSESDRHLCDGILPSTPSPQNTTANSSAPSIVQPSTQNAPSPILRSNNRQDTASSSAPANAPARPQNVPSPTPSSNNRQNSNRQAPSDRNQASKLNSTSVETYINQGLAYHKQRNYQQAISSYSRAIALNPNSVEAYSNRAAAYNEQKDYQKAIADSSKAISLNPTYANAYINRGLAYYHQGNYQQAIKDYNKAIELAPNNANAYNIRALAYAHLGNQQAAQADKRKAAVLSRQQPQ